MAIWSRVLDCLDCPASASQVTRLIVWSSVCCCHPSRSFRCAGFYQQIPHCNTFFWEFYCTNTISPIWSMASCCSQFFYEDDSDANNSQLSHWWYIALTSSHRRSQTILASVSGFGQIRFWKETIRISWSVFLIVNKSVVTGSVCHSEHQNHSNHCNALLHSAQNTQILKFEKCTGSRFRDPIIL